MRYFECIYVCDTPDIHSEFADLGVVEFVLLCGDMKDICVFFSCILSVGDCHPTTQSNTALI